MKNVTIILAVAAVLALAAPASGDINWNTGVTGSYDNADNWDTVNPPAAGDYARVAVPGLCKIDSAVEALYLYAGIYSSDGEVEVKTGGTFTGKYSDGTDGGSIEVGYGGDGLLTQTGGLIDANVNVGTVVHNDTAGTYKITGGQLGNSITDRKELVVGAASGGTGRFEIDDTTADGIAIGGIFAQYFKLYETGTLKIRLNAAGAVPLIQCYYAFYLSGAGTIELDASLYAAADGSAKVIDILQAGSAGNLYNYSGVTLTGAPAGSSLTDDGAGKLQIDYVPEPATLALLGIGGIGVLLRRKRR